VGEGFHSRAGAPHAEVEALDVAGDAARGSTVYVTLEPCSHHGKTPPCADALIAAGVANVVIGMPDPSRAGGGGAERLRSAGIDVAFSDDPGPFMALNDGWLTRETLGRPFVTVKSAISLDARVALKSGERAAITGDDGARVTQMLRGRADAVLVGAATVIADDPSLLARGDAGSLASRQPLRVVIARYRMPAPESAIFSDGAAPTLLVCPGAQPTVTMSDQVEVAVVDEGLGLGGVLELLGNRGVNELLVEPGPTLMTALWESGLIDRLVTVTAGGMAGPGAPSVYGGAADFEPAIAACALKHVFVPAEAGIVGDVSVTAWRQAPRAM
jgi:diaminohydroxyphosphoribosylaminopyrimidine deaminase/5-amino-6-(5-phosphoribosylamino)uracil reductase